MLQKTLAEESQNGLNIVDALFDPYYRVRFQKVVKSRFSSYGMGILDEVEEAPEGRGENAVCDVLGNIARAVNLGLGADETAVLFFTDSEKGSYVAGSSSEDTNGAEGSLLEDVRELVDKGFTPVLRTCARLDRATGVCSSGFFAVKGGALIAPIFINEKAGGLIVAAAEATRQFNAGDEGRLMLATVILGSVAQEMVSESRGEERLRSLAHGLSAALDARDPKTKGHSHRVAMYSMAILNEMDFDDGDPSHREFRDRILVAALLHDIGKILSLIHI